MSKRNENSVSIRVAGALSGAVYLDSLEDSVHALRSEVARLMGVCHMCGTPQITISYLQSSPL